MSVIDCAIRTVNRVHHDTGEDPTEDKIAMHAAIIASNEGESQSAIEEKAKSIAENNQKL